MNDTKEKATGRVKTGKNWGGAGRLKIKNPDNNFTYRLCDPDNVGVNQDLGYIKLGEDDLEKVGAPKHTGAVWMKLSKEDGAERDRFYEDKNKNLEKAIKPTHRKAAKAVAVDSSGNIKPLKESDEDVTFERQWQKK